MCMAWDIIRNRGNNSNICTLMSLSLYPSGRLMMLDKVHYPSSRNSPDISSLYKERFKHQVRIRFRDEYHILEVAVHFLEVMFASS